MTLESSKTLGGVGALLMVISPFSGFVAGAFSFVLGLVGIILVLIAMKGLSDHYNEGSIFDNSLYGVILSIVGGVVFVAALVMTALSFFSDVIGIDVYADWSDPAVFSTIDWANVLTVDIIMNHVAALIGSFVILFIFVVVAAIFYRKALTPLAEKTGVGLFGTTGLILLIGAVLTIIAIGFLLLWVALILLTVAFFSIRTEPTPPPPPTP